MRSVTSLKRRREVKLKEGITAIFPKKGAPIFGRKTGALFWHLHGWAYEADSTYSPHLVEDSQRLRFG
jgi:hypothetical protein